MRASAAVLLAAMLAGCAEGKQLAVQFAAPTTTAATPGWPRPPSGSRWIAQRISCGEPWDNRHIIR